MILVIVYLFILQFANSTRNLCIQEKFLDILPKLHCSESFALPKFTPGVPGNYEPYPPPPQGGDPTVIPNADKKIDIYEYGMSMTTSDSIPLDRPIKDYRHRACQYWNYPDQLPLTSVVIAFHNEGLSVLQRTIVSIINRSPQRTLREILLVDDFSSIGSYPHLGEKLEAWIARHTKVRLIRNGKREGLIRSKNIGVKEAKGEVVVFLDAHCEVGINWLPPLLTPILRDPHTLTVPIVHPIDHTTFGFSNVYRKNSRPVGLWEWGLLYKESQDLYDGPEANLTSPYPSPLHAGGLIAFNREYFLSVGGYDGGLRVWGGEQYDLSFKIWMCGGRVLWVPCSWVGHVYRKFVPYDFGEGVALSRNEDIVTGNLRRVVETWFDEEHLEYFYTRLPTARYLPLDDLSKVKKFRETCKPFSWFMREVASMVYDHFPKLPRNTEWGQILLDEQQAFHWGSNCKEPPCQIDSRTGRIFKIGFRLNQAGQLGLGERCLVPIHSSENIILQIQACPRGSVDGGWRYDRTRKLMMHRSPGSEEEMLCAQFTGDREFIQLKHCDGNRKQRWLWKN